MHVRVSLLSNTTARSQGTRLSGSEMQKPYEISVSSMRQAKMSVTPSNGIHISS